MDSIGENQTTSEKQSLCIINRVLLLSLSEEKSNVYLSDIFFVKFYSNKRDREIKGNTAMFSWKFFASVLFYSHIDPSVVFFRCHSHLFPED